MRKITKFLALVNIWYSIRNMEHIKEASIIIIVKQDKMWRKPSLPKWRHSPHVIPWSEMYGRELWDNKSPSFSFLSLLYAFLSLLSCFKILSIVCRNESTIIDEWRVAKNSYGNGPGLILRHQSGICVESLMTIDTDWPWISCTSSSHTRILVLTFKQTDPFCELNCTPFCCQRPYKYILYTPDLGFALRLQWKCP
jgi:hypothetical protein